MHFTFLFCLFLITGHLERGHEEAESSWGKDTEAVLPFCVLTLAHICLYISVCITFSPRLFLFLSFSLRASLCFYFCKSSCLRMSVFFTFSPSVSARALCVYGSLSLALCVSVSPPQQTCAVCLEDFKVKDELGVLPCQHAFHRR